MTVRRREFSFKVKVAAFERSGGNCEQCTAKLFPGNQEYDHIIPDAMGGDPTLENCAVLCRSCHGAKSSRTDVPAIAKSKRVRRRHMGIKKHRTIRAWRNMRGEIVHADD